MPKLCIVIEAVETEGAGKQHDHCRNVTRYYDLDGNLLAQNDPCAPEYNREDGAWCVPNNLKIERV
jgi:hypothetical protein